MNLGVSCHLASRGTTHRGNAFASGVRSCNQTDPFLCVALSRCLILLSRFHPMTDLQARYILCESLPACQFPVFRPPTLPTAPCPLSFFLYPLLYDHCYYLLILFRSLGTQSSLLSTDDALRYALCSMRVSLLAGLSIALLGEKTAISQYACLTPMTEKPQKSRRPLKFQLVPGIRSQASNRQEALWRPGRAFFVLSA